MYISTPANKYCLYHYFALLILSGLLASPSSAGEENDGRDENLGSEVQALMHLSLAELLQISITQAGFFPTPAAEAPGYTQRIQLDPIDRTPNRTLANVLEGVAGVSVSHHPRLGVLLGVRGLSLDTNAKTLVMLEGQDINQNVHFGTMIGLDSPLIGDLENIELTLSPGGVVHGSGAINGFIELSPKNGTDHPGPFARYQYGATEDVHVTESGYGLKYGEGRDIFLYAGAVSKSGFHPTEFYDVPEPSNIDYDQGLVMGFAKTGYRLAGYWNHDSFDFNISFQDLAPWAAGVNRHDYWHQTMLTVRPRYRWEITDTNSLEVSIAAEWFDYGSNTDKDTGFSIRDEEHTNRGGSEKHWESKLVFRTEALNGHSIALGGLFGQRDFYTLDRFFRADATHSNESTTFDWSEASLFFEDIWELASLWEPLEPLALTFGVRWDTQSYGSLALGNNRHPAPGPQNESHWTPRVALAYKINKTMILRGAYQHGFRMPDAINHVWKPSWDKVVPGAGLPIGSETVDSFEINLHKTIPTHSLRIDANAYYNLHKDTLFFQQFTGSNGYVSEEIVRAVKCANASMPSDCDPSPSNFFGATINSKDDFEAAGGELVVAWEHSKMFQLRSSYGYARLIHAEASNERFPEHSIKLSLTNVFANEHITTRFDLNANSGYDISPDANRHEVYDHWRTLLNMSVAWQPHPGVTFSLTARNITGERTPSIAISGNPTTSALGENERFYNLSVSFNLFPSK